MESMSKLCSFYEVLEIVHVVLSACRDGIKALEKGQGTVFGSLFNAAAKINNGEYRLPPLPSPASSEEDTSDDDGKSSDSSDDDDDGDNKAAGGSAVVSMEAALAALLTSLYATVEAQEQLALRLQTPRLPVFKLSVIITSSDNYRTALRRCYASICNADQGTLFAKLSQPESKRVRQRRMIARLVHRRSEALLAWAQLQGIGDNALRNKAATEAPDAAVALGDTLQAPLVPPAAASAASPSAAATPQSPNAAATPTIAQIVASTQPLDQRPDQTAAPITKATSSVAASSPPTLLHHRKGSSIGSDTDEHDGVNLMSADGILSDVVATRRQVRADNEMDDDDDDDEIYFDFSGGNAAEKAPPPSSSSPQLPLQPEPSVLFTSATCIGRRNTRAFYLLKGYVQQTNEGLTEARMKTIRQSATVRHLLCTFGKTDYNILTFQVRSSQLQIGTSGPLMWAASLDICVSENFEDTDNKPDRWLEERTASEPPESDASKKYRWVELIQSEPCTRGAYAKARIVSMAANLLFPAEFEFYRSLERDDIVTPDDSPEWQNVRNRTVGEAAPYGRMVCFMLDRTSYPAQAFRLMEELRPDVAPLKLCIDQVNAPRSSYSTMVQVDYYTVSIIQANGTVLVKQSSAVYNKEHERAMEKDAAQAPPLIPALVPTLFDALYAAAEVLGVLDVYTLLKKSFDRLRLPVVNEPREYVLSYLSVIFGVTQNSTGALADTYELSDQSFAGGWITTVRVAYTQYPSDISKPFHSIDLYTCYSGTKKAARNDALLYVGKVNFMAELLRMLDYGPVVQRGHAEVLLLVRSPSHFALHEDTSTFAIPLPPHTAAAQGSMAPGEAVGPLVSTSMEHLLWYERVIANAIAQTVPKSITEVEAAVKGVHLTFVFEVVWYAKNADVFLSTLAEKDYTFGQFQFEEQPFLEKVSMADVKKDEFGRFGIPIIGQSPNVAIHLATRVLRERLDSGAPSKQSKAPPAPVAQKTTPQSAPSASVPNTATHRLLASEAEAANPPPSIHAVKRDGPPRSQELAEVAERRRGASMGMAS